MTAHSTAVTIGHGDSTASTGAKKKPVPMYHAEPARSDARTNRSQRGTGDSTGAEIGPAVRMSETPPKIERAAPMVGQHTEEILREYGIGEKAIADMETRKVVEQAEAPKKA